jgi:CBS domain-containing membrane protein
MSEHQRSGGRIVADFMTRKVFTLKIDKKLIMAKEIMEWAHTRHVPVINAAGEVVGMVSHRDLLAASVASNSSRISEIERKQHLWTVSVQEVLRSPVITISPAASIQEAARLLRRHKMGCLPVVETGKLVGIITDYDLLRAVEEM